MLFYDFEVMKTFEAQGFKLKEIIIRTTQCKATGYWKTNSVKYNFCCLHMSIYLCLGSST